MFVFFSPSKHLSGLPGNYDYYNEQEYQEQYDYDDDILNDVDDDATIPSHRPTILSDSILLTVDSGTTIRLPCLVDKLPGEPVNITSLIFIIGDSLETFLQFLASFRV